VGVLVICEAASTFAQSNVEESERTQSASDEVARSLFQAGKSAYESGNFRDALSFFEQSYQRSQRPALLYNIGQAADRLRQDDKAIESFTKYLDQTPDAPNRVHVERRIRALKEARQERQEQGAKVEAVAVPSPAAAPTPEQTAQQVPMTFAQENTGLLRAVSDNEATESEPVTYKWWFWTTVGAVVAGGTAVALALALGGTKSIQQEPYEGNVNSIQAP
jgi:tetratricopeptide (TPR) repeat protein